MIQYLGLKHRFSFELRLSGNMRSDEVGSYLVTVAKQINHRGIIT